MKKYIIGFLILIISFVFFQKQVNAKVLLEDRLQGVRKVILGNGYLIKLCKEKVEKAPINDINPENPPPMLNPDNQASDPGNIPNMPDYKKICESYTNTILADLMYEYESGKIVKAGEKLEKVLLLNEKLYRTDSLAIEYYDNDPNKKSTQLKREHYQQLWLIDPNVEGGQSDGLGAIDIVYKQNSPMIDREYPNFDGGIDIMKQGEIQDFSIQFQNAPDFDFYSFEKIEKHVQDVTLLEIEPSLVSPTPGKKIVSKLMVPIKSTPTSIPPSIYIPNDSFISLLAQKCQGSQNNEKISLSYLPFNFISNFKEKYKFDDMVPCQMGMGQENNKMGLYIRFEKRTDDNSFPVSIVKIGTNNSVDNYAGELDFEKPNMIDPLFTIDTIKYVVLIDQPGPYGLSSKGVWVNVVGYKKLNDYWLIGRSLKIIELNTELENIFKKYADSRDYQVEDPEFPKYTVNSKVEEFIQEFKQIYFQSYEKLLPIYKEMVDGITTDLSSINLK